MEYSCYFGGWASRKYFRTIPNVDSCVCCCCLFMFFFHHNTQRAHLITGYTHKSSNIAVCSDCVIIMFTNSQRSNRYDSVFIRAKLQMNTSNSFFIFIDISLATSCSGEEHNGPIGTVHFFFSADEIPQDEKKRGINLISINYKISNFTLIKVLIWARWLSG